MAIQVIHVSDIHFGSGESHGPLNPETGLNVRFEDFVAALKRVVDYALEIEADLFLFSGDAYRNASPEPIYQKMFASELKRLSAAGVNTILVVGNHDQILRGTGSHAMSVFQSLEVPGVITIDRPTKLKLATKRGELQVIGLPHITRHHLLALEKYANSTASQIDTLLVDHVDTVLKGFYGEIDASLPTIVTAHMTVDRAVAGIEQELLVGYTLTFPSDIFMNECVDYVALGHVHRHQTIHRQNPAVVYAGSLERVDFGEEKEDKGFVHVQLARGNTTFEFKSIQPRPFVTVEVDVVQEENPTAKICEKIQKSLKPGCVLRVCYRIGQEQFELIDESKIRAAAKQALTIRLLPEVVPSQSRARMPQLNESCVTSPMVALEAFLEEMAPERKDLLMQRARGVMQEVAAEFDGRDESV
jgi:DNA repair protein SbcD/Mre11